MIMPEHTVPLLEEEDEAGLSKEATMGIDSLFFCVHVPW